MYMSNKRVIVYRRVSTGNQKDEGTIEVQTYEIDQYCANMGYEIVATFKDDGVSGGLEDRPGLAEMFNYLESPEGKKVDAVVILKLDRLARDLYIQEHLIKKLEALKMPLISTKEPDLNSKDPMRKAFRQFMGIVSELEKAFITMRLSGGRNNKARKGGYAGGRVALGYASKDKDLSPILAEADLINRIYHMKRYNRLSINQIARTLNKQGAETKRGGKWYASTVAYILNNPIYTGRYLYRDIESKRMDLALLNGKADISIQ